MLEMASSPQPSPPEEERGKAEKTENIKSLARHLNFDLPGVLLNVFDGLPLIP